MESDIIIVGLGPGDPNMVPVGVMKILGSKDKVYLRTERHPVVPWLKQQGYSFCTFDECYERETDFEAVYKEICEKIMKLTSHGQVVYAVPGHPLVAERSVELIIERADAEGRRCSIVPAMSFLDALWTVLRINPIAGVRVLDGLGITEKELNPAVATVVAQVHNRLVASDVKLALLERYPSEYPVAIVRAAGVPGQESVDWLPLYKLDRTNNMDHLTTVYLPPLTGRKQVKGDAGTEFPLDPLVRVLAELRGPGGCPWDQEQNHSTLAPYLLEEAHEVIEAINQDNTYKICEELGDLLLQIVFHAQIALENSHFDINDVVAGITEKMIRRHPHVFSGQRVANSREVAINWERIKQLEKGSGNSGTVIPHGMGRGWPALMQAQKIQAMAAKVGFDWPDYRGALDKTREELAELTEAVIKGDRKATSDELGDVLFAVVNLARLLRVDSETALLATTDRFMQRFQYIENKVVRDGGNWDKYTLADLDALWNEAKKLE